MTTHGRRWLFTVALLTGAPPLVFGWLERAHIPRVWDDELVEQMTLPIIGLGKPAHHVTSEYYYRIPVARIPKTYGPCLEAIPDESRRHVVRNTSRRSSRS